MTRLRRSPLVLLPVILQILLGACAFFNDKLPQVNESDIVGTWQADYSNSSADVDPSGVEVIVFREDGTYQQT